MAGLLVITLPLQLLCLLIVSEAQDFNDTNSGNSVPQLRGVDLPEGFIAYPDIGAAYKPINEQASWFEARKQCHVLGAQLALIDSLQLLKLIVDSKQEKFYTHVGIHNLFSNDIWTSIRNGAPLTSLPWIPSAPINMANSCVMIDDVQYGLINSPCEYEADYVCEILFGDGYVPYPDIGVGYKIPDDYVSWEEARRRCFNDGAQLAVIDSAKKFEYITKQKRSQGLTFVGIHSLFGNNEWVAIGDGKAVSFIPWAEGQPVNGGNHCVAANYSNSGLGNYPCYYRGDYVCERPISNTSQH